MRLPVPLGFLLSGLAATLVAPLPLAAQIAVITHPQTAVGSLSLEQLRRLYLGKTTTLEGGERVILLEYGPLRRTFYQRLLGLDEKRVKRHWLAVAFGGEDATPPREMDDRGKILRFVAGHRGALGFLDASATDSTVKVLAIEGLTPGDAAYPLR